LARQQQASVDPLISEVLEAETIFRVDPARSKIVRTRLPISRIAITDPTVIEVNEFDVNEIEVIGRKAGETTMTLWFRRPDGETAILRYIVQVATNQQEQLRADLQYGDLQRRVNEMFPYSQVQLIPIADKLIVRGQARDSKEAAEILAVIGGQSVDQAGQLQNQSVNLGAVARLPGASDLQTTSVISLLSVPGEHQVMLKVRIAEMTRSATRQLGVDFTHLGDDLAISNVLGGAGNITAILSDADLALFIRAFSGNGYSKVLAEPTLVTLSGQPATFIAGGEFAVPTTVGVEGVAAATTQFRGFGTQLVFTPTVIDKDRIRLQVAPSFSTLNQDNAVQGIPGLNTRAVTTTVDLREGQWLALAGLIQDEQQGSRGRVPLVGDLPVIGALFGNQSVERSETELVVLVSPQLVHPLEPEQVPLLLPGMEVTDPTNHDFFLRGQIEGNPEVQHRSTVWPARQARIRQQVHAKGTALHGKQQALYMCGDHGFSQ
jgi:pilus assembly protein CpaC